MKQIRGPVLESPASGLPEELKPLKRVTLRSEQRRDAKKPQLATRNALIADPMLQLPDAQCREQEALRAGERTHGWKISHLVILRDALSGATPARFSWAGGAGVLAQRNVADVVHNYWKAPSGPEEEWERWRMNG